MITLGLIRRREIVMREFKESDSVISNMLIERNAKRTNGSNNNAQINLMYYFLSTEIVEKGCLLNLSIKKISEETEISERTVRDFFKKLGTYTKKNSKTGEIETKGLNFVNKYVRDEIVLDGNNRQRKYNFDLVLTEEFYNRCNELEILIDERPTKEELELLNKNCNTNSYKKVNIVKNKTIVVEEHIQTITTTDINGNKNVSKTIVTDGKEETIEEKNFTIKNKNVIEDIIEEDIDEIDLSELDALFDDVDDVEALESEVLSSLCSDIRENGSSIIEITMTSEIENALIKEVDEIITNNLNDKNEANMIKVEQEFKNKYSLSREFFLYACKLVKDKNIFPITNYRRIFQRLLKLSDELYSSNNVILTEKNVKIIINKMI